MNKKEIIVKAQTIRTKLFEKFIDPQTGLVFSKINRENQNALDDTFFTGSQQISPVIPDGFSMADFYAFENASMATGSSMISEVLRYKRTKASDALTNAKAFFRSFRWIYELGKKMEPGFFPKPYGRRFSIETSTDQVLYACCAMEAFFPLADASERSQIEEMLPEMVAFWVRRKYCYHYFNWNDDSWMWPVVRFPPLLLLASKFSNNDIFIREYDRLVHLTAVSENELLHKKKTGALPLPDWEKKYNGYILSASADRLAMDTMQYDLLLRHDPDNPLAQTWKANLGLLWRDCSSALLPNGKAYSSYLIDFETDKARPMPINTTGDNTFCHGASTAWSTMIVRGGLQLAEYLPELAESTRGLAENVLEKLNFADLSYYDEPERFATSQRFKTKFLSGDAIGNYLWCAELLSK